MKQRKKRINDFDWISGYTFDTIGNRITSRKDAETQSYVSNDLNQYTEIQDSQGTITPSYDADGNLTTDSRFTYTWNGENRLIHVESPGSAGHQCLFYLSGIESSYDYKGRRIEKKVYENGVFIKHELFIYDGFKCIEKLDALNGNSLLQKFIWYGEKILSVTTGSDTYYYLHDANKNVSELVDDNGNIVAHYEYSPFGKVITSTGSYANDNPYRFSSEYSDDETALIYYNYRYYSPELGRWLSRDPIFIRNPLLFSGTKLKIKTILPLNLYDFNYNNPISLYDILGLFVIVDWDIKKLMYPKPVQPWPHLFLRNDPTYHNKKCSLRPAYIQYIKFKFLKGYFSSFSALTDIKINLAGDVK